MSKPSARSLASNAASSFFDEVGQVGIKGFIAFFTGGQHDLQTVSADGDLLGVDDLNLDVPVLRLLGAVQLWALIQALVDVCCHDVSLLSNS